jgi:hypothetical protein
VEQSGRRCVLYFDRLAVLESPVDDLWIDTVNASAARECAKLRKDI